MTRSRIQRLVDTVGLSHPTIPHCECARTIQPTETLTKDRSLSLVRCLARGALAGGPGPASWAELSIRDQTAVAVLWMDGGRFAQRQLGQRHATSTRRMPPFLPRSRRGKPGEVASLIHHRSKRVTISQSLTRHADRPHAPVEMGGSPVHLCYHEVSRGAELGNSKVVWHGTTWDGWADQQ